MTSTTRRLNHQLSRSASIQQDDVRWPFLLTAFILLTLVYPPFLYSSDIQVVLTPVGVVLFWLHTILSALALLLAYRLRDTALFTVQFFHWIFFVVALREQLIHNWDPIFTLTGVVDRGLLFLIFYELFVLVAYMGFATLWRPSRSQGDLKQRKIASPNSLFLLLSFSLILNLSLLFAFGDALFHSRDAFNTRSQELFPNQSVLLYRQFLRPFLYFLPLFILRHLLSAAFFRLGPMATPLLLLAFFSTTLGYLFNNPVCAPRFHSGAILVGTVMLFAGPRRIAFLTGVLLCGLVASPFFNSFRNQWTLDRSDFALPGLDVSHFRSWDFDAFVNYLYGVHFVDEYGQYAGRNLLSAVLFFVPDELWRGKISSSGETVMATVAWQFRGNFPSNSSMPMIGEGFLAAGPAGVIAIALIFAATIRALDMAPRGIPAGDTGLYPRLAMLAFTPVLMFFLCRGPLVPTFAFGLGTLSAAATAAWLISRVAKNRDAAGDDGGEKGDRSSGFARAGFAKRLRGHRARREAAVQSVPPSRSGSAPATPASEGAQRTTRRSSGPISVSARRVDEGASAGPGFHR